jgi:hypothetical protein
MKIKFKIPDLVVEVDPQAWEDEYGIDASDRVAIIEDVRKYCFGQLAESAAAQAGALKVVLS